MRRLPMYPVVRGLRLPVLLALLLSAAGCAGRRPPETAPRPDVPEGGVGEGWSQVGVASWYGPNFDGRPTASGEIFHMEAMTAAHRTLPLGTRVEVTVLATGRRSVLRINDRGPFVEGRILDASRGAARRLGFLRDGTARVRVVVTEVPSGCWEVQVGAYARDENVRDARRRVRRAGEPARTERAPDGMTRVVAGPYGTVEEAREARARFGGFVRECGPAG